MEVIFRSATFKSYNSAKISYAVGILFADMCYLLALLRSPDSLNYFYWHCLSDNRHFLNVKTRFTLIYSIYCNRVLFNMKYYNCMLLEYPEHSKFSMNQRQSPCSSHVVIVESVFLRYCLHLKANSHKSF